MPCTVVFLLPYFGLDLFNLGLYLGFEYIMGVMLVPSSDKYKSISVSVDTYRKIVQIATKERRNISQQLSIIVDDAHMDLDRPNEIAPRFQPRKRGTKDDLSPAGLSAVIED